MKLFRPVSVVLACLLLTVSVSVPVTGATKAKSTTAPPQANKKTPTAAPKPTAKAKKSSKKSQTRQAKVPKQTAPTPDRVREIQQALASHGYAVETSGSIDPATTEALKQFQEKQNLQPTGKLNSLTLISLGLGPKREATSAPANPPVQKDNP